MIHCALCINDKTGSYFIYLHTVVISILHNASRPVCLHIIADETLGPERRRLLEDMATAQGGRAVFYEAPSIPAEAVDSIQTRFGIGTMYRLFLHELAACDKLIYLDCDMAVNMDIAELYDVDLGEHYLGAVEEPNLTRHDKIQGLGCFPKLPVRYFNAGMLLMNLRKFRELCAKKNILLETFIKNHATLVYNDQDVLNGTLASIEGSVLFLDEKFNYIINSTGRMLESLPELRGKIVHYTLIKPLDSFYPAILPFWKYLPTGGGQTALFEAIERLPPRKELLLCQTALYTKKRAAKFRRYYDLRAFGLLGFIKRRLFPKKYKHMTPRPGFLRK